ncbi:MAG TPA: asparaginase [Polaromonas sp.]|uniref:asparaginase n=1 Tax=Polaromonas sp. TaxID=1869339 RepID=UPI002D4C40BC|nr:asparaginase [Polaromonas sp.]HYW58648.1 asparaginase [Polaromonas sp.]
MKPQTIVILGTGGTIAGRAARPSEALAYVAAQVGIDQLVADIPSITDNGPVETEQVSQIDSKDMGFAIWAELANRVNHHLARAEVQGIVITHGTDTLEETAYFVHAVCNPDKPVVLTCAMRPATALFPDGPQNVLDAVAVARHSGARGVVAVCAGVVHSALDVQKTHTYQLDAFSSGDAGPTAYVEAGSLRLLRNWPSAQEERAIAAMKTIAKLGAGPGWPRVEIVMSHAGASGALVDALLVQGGVQGLVVAATGNGTIHHALEAALLKARDAGVRVVRSTRCLQGRVLATPGDIFPDSGGLGPVKARVALMLSLMVL